MGYDTDSSVHYSHPYDELTPYDKGGALAKPSTALLKKSPSLPKQSSSHPRRSPSLHKQSHSLPKKSPSTQRSSKASC